MDAAPEPAAELPEIDATLLLTALRNQEELGERFWNCRIVGDVDWCGLSPGLPVERREKPTATFSEILVRCRATSGTITSST